MYTNVYLPLSFHIFVSINQIQVIYIRPTCFDQF
jgi:hypothetical protein